MLPKIDGKYLFILPLPSSSPKEHNATLYGVVYAFTDAAFNLIGKKELLICKGLSYKLPSPSYLFAQGIDPYTIKTAPTEYEFYQKLKAILTTPNTDVFTWSLHNLKIARKLALRLADVDAFDNLQSLVDVNKLVKLDEYFATGNIFASDSLLLCANHCLFTQKIAYDDHEGKLDALIYLVKHLCDNSYALLQYCTQGRTFNLKKFESAIAKRQTLLDLNLQKRQLEILLPLALDKAQKNVSALVFDGQSVVYKNLELCDFGIWSPSSVLTPQRVQTTKFDLNEANSTLLSTDVSKLSFDASSISEEQRFLTSLSDKDREYYLNLRFANKHGITSPELCYSKTLRQLVFLLRGNNFANTLIDQELQFFYQHCRKMLLEGAVVYSKELALLANKIDENNESQLKLVDKIGSYLNNL